MPIQVIERVKGPLFFDRQVMPPYVSPWSYTRSINWFLTRGWMTILFFALDECDFITLYTLATNHGLLSIAALSCLRIRLNIMLKRFVVFPVNLRKHLDLTKSVLSGSFVLELMLYRMGWFCNDLDIYTTKPFVDKWDQFLKLQGYVVVDVSESDIVSDTEDENTATIHSPTIAELRTYEACIRGVIRRIDVVVSETDSALDPICHFWSSCLQNFVTGKRIVISHPVTTCAGRWLSPQVATSIIVYSNWSGSIGNVESMW